MIRIGSPNLLMLDRVSTVSYQIVRIQTFCFFPSQDFRVNKPSNIISTLVSIYDSKDLFVKELQVLLAQRLLATKDDDLEKVELEVPLSDYDLLHGRLMFSCLSTEAKH